MRLAAVHKTTLFLLLCVLAVYGLSVWKKIESYRAWQAHPQAHFVDDMPIMAEMDAYHWLKMARDLDAGYLGKGLVNATKGYPDGMEYYDANLLARLISAGARFTDGDYYRSGLVLVTLLGGLFVFPLLFYCHRLGFGAAAVMGGLVGVFSRAYYERSWMGFVDTDMLNLFFPLAVACFILPIGRENSPGRNLLLACGAGGMMFLYNWWYEQFGLMLVYLFVMALYLVLGRVAWKQTLVLLSVFVLASGPIYAVSSFDSVLVFVRAYFFPLPSGAIVWPGVMELIVEAQVFEPLVTLKRIHGLLPLVVAGLAGLLYLLLRYPRRMLPVVPMLLVGFWSLSGPMRFAMYLAPFVGVGLGVLVELVIRKGLSPLRRPALLHTPLAVAVMLVIFFATTDSTAYNRQPQPIVPVDYVRAILDVKKLVPQNAAMFTWWDNGYVLMDIGDFATYHDGALHGGLRTTLIGKALFSPRQEELTAVISYLEDQGFESLEEWIATGNVTGQMLEQRVFSYPETLSGGDVYLLYSEDMLRKFGSITEAGAWDFDARKSDWVFYERWNCTSRTGNLYQCREGTIDLNRGVLTDGIVNVPLNAVVYVANGTLTQRQDFRTDGTHYLQMLYRDNRLYQVQVVENRLFKSNFNQQFVLGNYDRRYFEEIYNRFPVARVFRVRR